MSAITASNFPAGPAAGGSPAARCAKAKTAAAPSVREASAQGKEIASAAKPIRGGPARKPSEPIEDTAAIAGPGGVPRCRPAALNISGTPLETPSPIANNPASAAAG